jgi:hypothetical protein
MLEGLVLSLLGYACYCHCESIELNVEYISSFIVAFLDVWMYSSTSIYKLLFICLILPQPAPLLFPAAVVTAWRR